MRIKDAIFTIVITALSCNFIFCQGNKCDCQSRAITNLCYLTAQEYCLYQPGCEHAIDGEFMRDYLVPKLLNTNNFGIDGISSCNINLIPIKKLKNVQTLNDAECHIFMVGSFAVDTVTFEVTSEKTSVPNNVLNYIKQWSTECESNLVIVAQEEAKVWGYEIENLNVNPNTANTGFNTLNIFKGPFGSLTTFSQGGTYQGVINKTPSTGHEVLARDARNKPTVAFDKATNDIILGDIGILCGLAGSLSPGSNINSFNSNDVLAGNIFALGCDLSNGKKFSSEDIYICKEKPYTLPNGVTVDSEVTITDTLKTVRNCDSIHIYKVYVREGFINYFNKEICDGDSTKFRIGDLEFNQQFTKGTVILPDKYKCDSTIFVNIKINPVNQTLIEEYPCFKDNYSITVGNDIYNSLNKNGKTVLKNKYGCDSIVAVNLYFGKQDTTYITDTLCHYDSLLFDNEFYRAGFSYNITYNTLNPCDSLVILKLDTFKTEKYDVPLNVTMKMYETYSFNNSLNNNEGEISWNYEPGLSCIDCLNPKFKVKEYPELFIMSIKDKNNCLQRFEIDPDYVCSPVLPNIISTSAVNEINKKISFYTDCPIEQFQVEIYNRWGNKVFQSRDMEETWDGRYQGRFLQSGVYTYRILYKSDGNDQFVTGDITLID